MAFPREKSSFLEFMIDRDSLAKGQSYLKLASRAGIALPRTTVGSIGYRMDWNACAMRDEQMARVGSPDPSAIIHDEVATS